MKETPLVMAMGSADTQSFSTELAIGRILLFAGAAMAGVMALMMLAFLSVLLLAPGGPPPDFVFLPIGLLGLFVLIGIAGVVVNLVAASRVSSDPRRAAVLGVVAAFLPPTNLFSLAGAILIFISPEGRRQREEPLEPVTPRD